MNELQKNIYKIIISIIETNGILGRFEDKKNYGHDKIINNSAIRYGILNYVAKYSLANSTYFITSKCYDHIDNLGLLKKGKLLRGSKGSKNRFTFEHAVPSNVIADEVIKNIGDNNKIMENNIDIVVKNENILISAHGNSIRALCKYLFNLDNNQLSKLEIPTGNPLLIKFDSEDKILNCEYLDSVRAKDLLVY